MISGGSTVKNWLDGSVYLIRLGLLITSPEPVCGGLIESKGMFKVLAPGCYYGLLSATRPVLRNRSAILNKFLLGIGLAVSSLLDE